MAFLQDFVIGWGKEIVALLATLSAVFFDTYNKEERRFTTPGRYLLPVVVLIAVTQGVAGWLRSEQKSTENGRKEFQRATEAARYANQVFPSDVVGIVEHTVTLPSSNPPLDPAIFNQPWRLLLRVNTGGIQANESPIEIMLYPEERDHTYRFKDLDDYIAHIHTERAVFIGKYANLGRFGVADSWNGATVAISLQAPHDLDLAGVKNAIPSSDAAAHRSQLESADYANKELPPQVESLPNTIAVSLYVRNRAAGTASGFWARVTLAHFEWVDQFNAETFGDIRVARDLFFVPDGGSFVHDRVAERIEMLAIGVLSVGGSLVLIGMAVVAHRKEERKSPASSPNAPS